MRWLRYTGEITIDPHKKDTESLLNLRVQENFTVLKLKIYLMMAMLNQITQP